MGCVLNAALVQNPKFKKGFPSIGQVVQDAVRPQHEKDVVFLDLVIRQVADKRVRLQRIPNRDNLNAVFGGERQFF